LLQNKCYLSKKASRHSSIDPRSLIGYLKHVIKEYSIKRRVSG
jgi:hypothetical protein